MSEENWDLPDSPLNDFDFVEAYDDEPSIDERMLEENAAPSAINCAFIGVGGGGGEGPAGVGPGGGDPTGGGGPGGGGGGHTPAAANRRGSHRRPLPVRTSNPSLQSHGIGAEWKSLPKAETFQTVWHRPCRNSCMWT